MRVPRLALSEMLSAPFAIVLAVACALAVCAPAQSAWAQVQDRQPGDQTTDPTGDPTGDQTGADETTEALAEGEQQAAATAPPSSRRTTAWLGFGAAAALATTGAILALSADAREAELGSLLNLRGIDGRPIPFSGETESRYRTLVREGEQLNFYAWVALGLAGVTALSAVGLVVFESPGADSKAAQNRPRRTPTLTPALTPELARDRVGVTLGWEF